MKNRLKIILTGLEYARKTSILIALERKYNFRTEVFNLKPTIKIDYHKIVKRFLSKNLTVMNYLMEEKY